MGRHPDEGRLEALRREVIIHHLAGRPGDRADDAVERFSDRVLSFLEAWGLDGLRENVEVRYAFIPHDFESRFNAFEEMPSGRSRS